MTSPERRGQLPSPNVGRGVGGEGRSSPTPNAQHLPASGDPKRAKRITRLRQELSASGFDGLLVSQPESRLYLSGYTARDLPPRDSSGYLLITEARLYLLTDRRTDVQAAAEAPGFDVTTYGGSVTMPALLKDLVANHALGAAGSAPPVLGPVLGFEADHLPYGLWQEVSSTLEGLADLRPAQGMLDRLRMQKDDGEIEDLLASLALNDAAFAHLARSVRPGRTELDMAWELESFLRKSAGAHVAFDPITVAGPNTALPHAVPSERPIEANEMLLFDTGANLRGYCSDMTRSFFMGDVAAPLTDVWKVVLDAQLTAVAKVQPGMTGAEVDGIARAVIDAAGFGESFVHGLGHGIGLEVHEPPWLTRTRGSDVLLPGMVFTIEPGIYLPGVGGVRLEDVVLLTERGAEVLTNSPKKMQLSEVLVDLDG